MQNAEQVVKFITVGALYIHKKLTSEQRECRRQDRRGLNIQKADAGICFFDIYLPFHLPYVVQTIIRINDFERRASHRTQSLSLVQLNNDNS